MHTSLHQLSNQNTIIFFQNFVHLDTAMTPSLPNVDNGGHLVSPFLPPSVYVVIECPLMSYETLRNPKEPLLGTHMNFPKEY